MAGRTAAAAVVQCAARQTRNRAPPAVRSPAPRPQAEDPRPAAPRRSRRRRAGQTASAARAFRIALRARPRIRRRARAPSERGPVKGQVAVHLARRRASRARVCRARRGGPAPPRCAGDSCSLGQSARAATVSDNVPAVSSSAIGNVRIAATGPYPAPPPCNQDTRLISDHSIGTAPGGLRPKRHGDCDTMRTPAAAAAGCILRTRPPPTKTSQQTRPAVRLGLGCAHPLGLNPQRSNLHQQQRALWPRPSQAAAGSRRPAVRVTHTDTTHTRKEAEEHHSAAVGSARRRPRHRAAPRRRHIKLLRFGGQRRLDRFGHQLAVSSRRARCPRSRSSHPPRPARPRQRRPLVGRRALAPVRASACRRLTLALPGVRVRGADTSAHGRADPHSFASGARSRLHRMRDGAARAPATRL